MANANGNPVAIDSGGNVSDWPLRIVAAWLVECFPGKLSWVSEWTGLPGGKVYAL